MECFSDRVSDTSNLPPVIIFFNYKTGDQCRDKVNIICMFTCFACVFSLYRNFIGASSISMKAVVLGILNSIHNY